MSGLREQLVLICRHLISLVIAVTVLVLQEVPAGDQVILDGILDSGVLGDEQSPDALKGEVLGDRKSPIQKALDNGTSVRKVILTKEGSAGLSFPWWIILLILGAYGAKKYIEHENQKKKEERKNG